TEALELQRVLQTEHDVRLVLDDQDGLSGLHPGRIVTTKSQRAAPLSEQPPARSGRSARGYGCGSGIGAALSLVRKVAPAQAMNVVAPGCGVFAPKRRIRRWLAGQLATSSGLLPSTASGST